MQKHLDFLNLLSKTHTIQQRALLETAELDQARAICECICSIMHGNILIPQGIKEELILKKQVLHDLADTKVPPYKRNKNLRSQSGGSILGALLPTVISATLGFINNSKK